MADTIIRYVDPQWLPKNLHNKVWTDFEDASIVQKGTILFDHRSHTMYAGEIVGMGERNGRYLYIINWYKSEDNVIHESLTLAQLEAAEGRNIYYWIDPCMQED